MKKLILVALVGLFCNSCVNDNSVDRPYIISQGQDDSDEVVHVD